MKIFIASDHAGFEMKKKIIPFLVGLGHEVVDEGPFSYEPNDDYTDFTILVAKETAGQPSEEIRGVVIGGSGQGEAIAANRFPGVRAMVYYGGKADVAKVSREHNDSNVFCVGARFAPEKEIKNVLKLWLATDFSKEERHIRRLAKIEAPQGKK